MLKGNFSTAYFEKAFKVKTIHLPKKYLGWGAGKVHILNYAKLDEGRYLILDSDIIFIGKVIDKLQANTSDFIVHGERYEQPFTEKVKEVFLDPEKVITLYPDYEYPGFFFNTGQFVARLNAISKDIISPGFNADKYSYFLHRDLFKLPDQAFLNAIFPVAQKKKQIKLGEMEFVFWSNEFFNKAENDNPELYKTGDQFPYLIHYAGDVRTIDLNKMKGKNILKFFKEVYEQKLGSGRTKFSQLQDYIHSIEWLTRLFFIKNRIAMRVFNLN